MNSFCSAAWLGWEHMHGQVPANKQQINKPQGFDCSPLSVCIQEHAPLTDTQTLLWQAFGKALLAIYGKYIFTLGIVHP